MTVDKIFGLDINSGRIVSLLASIGIGTVLFQTAFSYLKDKFSTRLFSFLFSFMIFLLFFVSKNIFYWALTYRVDMLTVFFIALGVYLGFDITGTEDPKKIGSCFFFLLAFFTKATSVCSIGILFGYWAFLEFLERRRKGTKPWPRHTLQLLLLFLGIAFGIILLLQHLTHGWYLRNVYGIMKATSSWNFYRGFSLFVAFIQDTLPLVCLFFLAILLNLKKKDICPKFFLIVLGGFGSLYFLLFTSLREGADSNYFLEPYFWLWFILALSLKDFLQSRFRLVFIGFLLFFAGMIFYFTSFWWKMDHFKVGDPRFYMTDKLLKDQISKIIQRTDKNVLTDDLCISLSAGKTPVFEPFLMGMLIQRGDWDPSAFIADLKRGEYPYLIVADRIFMQVPFLPEIAKEYYKVIWQMRSSRSNFREYEWKIFEYVPKT